ncbi:MAG: 6,7-dimethyl-8-ribityllumazine synthase [Proteobacteria bacterium]|jgi:6,7-dimethyl-8-ribityllumazine synthase|uniref:6,7-dimethyl-8-ribityllumazine synthase n=1 Tax=Candidatus Fonsibacter lacus TaxID=2576439 RepID=A0A845S5T8_9PROT|nr:6,7-dimethyl-8-ribityllumazine synthase [Candidatus Fonsibacter lacus]NBP60352.1 6,7-dimethyl-8-ribityllumazine synthase [Pseudomonadota bacterium]NBO62584.1 6,7-dimethyl-8-ribityllumazine synthase [Candidatus Fonsibacter lacus]NBP31280.1 6,7-dimethyl-8-ribityllumazine synthase [Candidatus Fonsibacter lacus]NBV39745.1 6,7-dimethyl-8-ribityllumazine synthase [Candidatus Fonsibacter lacus]
MKKKILIVSSSFYKNFEKNLLLGALKEIDKKLFDVKLYSVSGAYEIPQLLNILLKDNKYAFCIALGCIIKGQTPHFDIISQSVSDKLLEISIKYNVPVSNGVLNCNNSKQAEVRCDPKLKNKGGEAVRAALSVYNSIYKL